MPDIESRVKVLEDWREQARDLIARQGVVNEQMVATSQQLTAIIQNHEQRLATGEMQRALIVNTAKTTWTVIAVVGAVLAVLIPLMNTLMGRWIKP